jgi:antibiotic biosynthesis monooxygenase (ABM) superfamily enzyme
MNDHTAPALLIVMVDINPEHEDDFNRWYNEEHLPDRVGLPGFISARRFISYEDGPKYLAIYELENVDALQTEAYLALTSPRTEWTTKVESRFTSRLRAVYTEIFPPFEGLGPAE